MKTKTAVIIGSVILAFLAVVAGIYAATQIRGDVSSYAAKISKGHTFLERGDYDNAMLEFQSAIQLDDTQEDGYIGLSMVYRQQGRLDDAKSILQTGLQKSSSNARIQAQLMTNFPNQDAITGIRSDAAEYEPEAGKDLKNISSTVDSDLLRFLATATFSDYLYTYPDLSSRLDGDRCVVTFSNLNAALIYYDTADTRVIDHTTQEPYREFRPNEIIYYNISELFGGISSMTYENLNEVSGVSTLAQNGDSIEMELYGCRMIIPCREDGTATLNAQGTIYPTGVYTSTGDHVLTGTIIDASNGSPVPGAELNFYAGFGTQGTHYSTVSDEIGKYTVNVAESGAFTVIISKLGYITETFQIYVTGLSAESHNNFTISTELGQGMYRIVLTWGALPPDLDSHLTGTASDGTYIHVYYQAMTAIARDGSNIAMLDVDDTDGYGPETTTIRDTNGSFYFDVVDYTKSTGVGGSGAQVKIYKGNSLAYTVTPDGSVGMEWRVCQIINGEIIIINQDKPIPTPAPTARPQTSRPQQTQAPVQPEIPISDYPGSGDQVILEPFPFEDIGGDGEYIVIGDFDPHLWG